MATIGLIDRYLALPGELQSMILSYCTKNDLVCLSLANKTLHSVFTPPKPLHLHTNEILCPPKSPELLPTSHPCYRNPWQILQACKASDYHQNLCRLNQCFHDDSFDCELWTRLHEWMPKGTRYCRECRRFTKRDKRRRKGACKCIRVSRRMPGNNWTYTKYHGYHRDFWKLYYTEANLAKLIRRSGEPRTNTSPYGLRERTKPTRKLLEHTSQYQYTKNPYGHWYRSDFT